MSKNLFNLLISGELAEPAVEYRFRHADGRWIYLESAVTNLLGTQEVDGIVLTSRDVTRGNRQKNSFTKPILSLPMLMMPPLKAGRTHLICAIRKPKVIHRRVTEMTIILARALGIYGEDLIHIRRGAFLHDIGKMGIPDQILLKPGPLTDEEWNEMRKHPVYAYDMLHPIAYLRPALDIPL